MRTERKTATIKSNVGPGSYDFAKYINNAKNSKGYTIGTKLKQTEASRDGGPGTYDVEHGKSATKERSRSAKFGRSPARFSQTETSGAAPG